MTTETQAPEGGPTLSDDRIDEILAEHSGYVDFGSSEKWFDGLGFARAVIAADRAVLAAQPQETAMRAEHLDDRDELVNGHPNYASAAQSPAEGDAAPWSKTVEAVSLLLNRATQWPIDDCENFAATIIGMVTTTNPQPKHTPTLTDRQISVIRYALLRFASQARSRADEAAQKTSTLPPEAVASFLADAKDAEELRAMFAAPAQSPAVKAESDEAEFEVWEGDELFAGTSGPRAQAWAELLRYAAQCEGVVRVFEVNRVERALSYVPVQGSQS